MKLALLATTFFCPTPFDGSLLQISYSDEGDIPEAFRSLYTEKDGKFNLTGIQGMKTDGDVARVSEALRKERNDHKKLRDAVRGAFGNDSPDFADIRTQLDSVEELTAQLAAAGNPKDNKAVESLVEARVKAKTGPMERELATLRTSLTEKDGIITGFTTEKRTRAIHDAVREQATKLKLVPEAMDDVLMNAERLFEQDEDGNVVMKDNVGFTPGIDPTVWLTEMQTKRPFWWPASSGGGAGGGDGPKGMAKNPWAADSWNMTEQSVVYKANPTRAAQLAAAAGTKIGGLPAKKS